MRVLLSTYGSRGDVEPLVALAVQLQRRGAEVRMCAPPDEELVDLLEREGVPHLPFLKPWRSWERPPTPEERHQRVTDFITAQYDTVAEAAAGCDAVVATAMSQFVAPSVAEGLGIPYHYVLFCPDVVDGLDGRGFNELFKEPIDAHRSSIGLPPVSDVSEFMFTARPLLAADPVLGPWHGTSNLDVVQTGARLLADDRPLPADLLAFLDAGEEPVYVGFGSMRTVGEESVRVAVEAIRAHGRRVVIGRGWAGLDVIDGRDDCFVIGEVNHQRLFGRVAAVVHHGGAGTTTTAYRVGAPPRWSCLRPATRPTGPGESPSSASGSGSPMTAPHRRSSRSPPLSAPPWRPRSARGRPRWLPRPGSTGLLGPQRCCSPMSSESQQQNSWRPRRADESPGERKFVRHGHTPRARVGAAA